VKGIRRFYKVKLFALATLAAKFSRKPFNRCLSKIKACRASLALDISMNDEDPAFRQNRSKNRTLGQQRARPRSARPLSTEDVYLSTLGWTIDNSRKQNRLHPSFASARFSGIYAYTVREREGEASSLRKIAPYSLSIDNAGSIQSARLLDQR